MTTSVTKAILKQCDEVSDLLKSLSHPVRLKILCQVMERERSVNELTEFCDISQSAMSQFLNRMKNEGILTSRREHNFVYYAVADQKLIQLMRAIKEIYT
ncbi:metalloregulator ArsR/SmtB family transcription factor [Bdellovibrionota bacterium FG-1]